MRRPGETIACVLAAAAVLFAGCSDGDSASGGDKPRGAPYKVTVNVTRDGYRPERVEVRVGGSITWINRDPTLPHTAETIDPQYKNLPGGEDGSFDTHTLSWGEPYTVTFHKPGTYEYTSSYDRLRPGWNGTIDVIAPTPPSQQRQ